jgi:hypothetical protein
MQKQPKKIKSLFVQDLVRVQGGTTAQVHMPCPQYTTLACGEEPNGCSGC